MQTAFKDVSSTEPSEKGVIVANEDPRAHARQKFKYITPNEDKPVYLGEIEAAALQYILDNPGRILANRQIMADIPTRIHYSTIYILAEKIEGLHSLIKSGSRTAKTKRYFQYVEDTKTLYTPPEGYVLYDEDAKHDEEAHQTLTRQGKEDEQKQRERIAHILKRAAARQASGVTWEHPDMLPNIEGQYNAKARGHEAMIMDIEPARKGASENTVRGRDAMLPLESPPKKGRAAMILDID